jgi:hypothetical protein
MGKKLALVGSDNLYHLGAKGYLTVDGVYKSVKKMYLTQNGVHRLVFGGGVDVGAMVITYSAAGGMQDAGVVTMGDGKQYRLLTLTKSGTLTVPEEVQAEVWMCGGGANGVSTAANVYGDGGAGAYTATGAVALATSTTAVIGAGDSGASSFGAIQTKACSGKNGGTGGGGAYNSTPGTGDGVDKHPFGDSAFFPNAHCGGGGAGQYMSGGPMATNLYIGGNGGTNGGNGQAAGSTTSGAGGEFGGGNGGYADYTGATAGSAATFYGSGGGGGGLVSTMFTSGAAGGSGYQGVIYIRIPVEQAA